METGDTCTLLAVDFADASVRVFDIAGMYCTHVFCGHSGIIHCLCFNKLKLLYGGDAEVIKQ
jgi:WD40 repeat protein